MSQLRSVWHGLNMLASLGSKIIIPLFLPMPDTKQPQQQLFHKQQGAALLLFFLAVLISGTLFLVGKVALDKGSVAHEDNTTESLARAKEALLAFSVSFYERTNSAGNPWQGYYGFLPCPDTGAALCASGRLGRCRAAPRR